MYVSGTADPAYDRGVEEFTDVDESAEGRRIRVSLGPTFTHFADSVSTDTRGFHRRSFCALRDGRRTAFTEADSSCRRSIPRPDTTVDARAIAPGATFQTGG